MPDSNELIASLTNSIGATPGGGMNLALLAAWTIFGGIGFIAFVYGKKQQNWPILGIGLALMIYPYFVSSTFLNYLIGAILCVALYFFRQ